MLDIESQIPSLRRYANALTKGVGDDLLQSALARAVEKQHLYQPGTDPRAWLFTIVHNTFVNNVRKGARDVMVYGEDQRQIVENYQSVSDPSVGLMVRDLKRALAKLPVEQQQVLMLIGVEGLSYDEAADVLHLPLGTVRSRLSRGRHTLKQLMAV